MENKYFMVKVPYVDFVEGQKAISLIRAISDILSSGEGYCSNDIKVLLNIKKENDNARTD